MNEGILPHPLPTLQFFSSPLSFHEAAMDRSEAVCPSTSRTRSTASSRATPPTSEWPGTRRSGRGSRRGRGWYAFAVKGGGEGKPKSRTFSRKAPWDPFQHAKGELQLDFRAEKCEQFECSWSPPGFCTMPTSGQFLPRSFLSSSSGDGQRVRVL